MNTTDKILEDLDVLIEDSLRNSNPIDEALQSLTTNKP